jgi:large subunit ribosomal protein L6
MSRIGRKPIAVPKNVDLTIGANNEVSVKGPKGTLTQTFSPAMIITREDGEVSVARPDDEREHRALHGLTRTLLNNMVIGVTDGYRKNLEINGVGYRASLDGKTLVLNVGYSHPVRMVPPDGITYAVEGTNRVSVTGFDKQLVGEEAARIRGARPPEPYKGKGIKYEGEQIRRKAGKTGKAK